mmetsp:Transcript_19385/g.50377  ORF Transcript_19385/g.50377 Transcript_19385/m.50377 type:complete len:390 (-) Transcript_19385:534-1703(-)
MAAAAGAPGADDVRISGAELRSYATACLVAAGSLKEKAELVADVLVQADERNIPSHGVNRLDLYCDELRRGAVDAKAEPKVASDAPSVALVDGQNAQGPVVGKFCMDLAILKAKATGCAWVVCNNSNHYGIAGWYAMLATQQRMIGMSMTNTSPVCTPTRSRKPALGTNPIACAAPTTGDPVVLDMATPTVPFGKVEVKHRKGEECPPGWGVDSDGLATTNPSKIIFGGGVTPLGGGELTAGYKGYGLGLMVEMLSGVLAGSNVGPRIGMSMNPNAINRTDPINLGQCFVAIDPSKFCPGYEERLEELCGDLRSLPRADDAPGPVLIPGDPERTATEESKRVGVPLHPNIAATLVALGEKLDVPRPLAFAKVKPGKIWSGDKSIAKEGK